jgi:hypothetical protein
MSLHLISEDLRDHAWYEELYVHTIAEVEEYAARWAAFEELVAPLGDDPAELGA